MSNLLNIKYFTKLKRITQEHIEVINELREEKKTIKEISAILGYSATTVWKYAKRKGNVRPCHVQRLHQEKYERKIATIREIREKYASGAPYNELREEYNLSGTMFSLIVNNKSYHDPNYILPVRESLRNHFTDEEIMTIRKRYDDGEDIYMITDDYRHRIKTNPVGCIRNICRRVSYKNIK